MENIPEPFVDLVRMIVRLFYENIHVLMVEMLIQKRVMDDDEVSVMTKLPIKDVNKIFSKLRDDKLVRAEIRADTPAHEWERASTKNHYYIDYKQIVNLVKYKMYKMRQMIELPMKASVDNEGYQCPQCQTKYSLLDASRLVDWKTNLFLCETCHVELEVLEPTSTSGSGVVFSRFMEQCTPIIDLLKKIDGLDVSGLVLSGSVKPGTNRSLPKMPVSNYGVLKSTISVDIGERGPEKEDFVEHVVIDEDVETKNGDDERTVMVQGVPVKLSEITDEHRDRMTLDEYTDYYNVVSSE